MQPTSASFALNETVHCLARFRTGANVVEKAIGVGLARSTFDAKMLFEVSWCHSEEPRLSDVLTHLHPIVPARDGKAFSPGSPGSIVVG